MSNNQNSEAQTTIFTQLASKSGRWIFLVGCAALLLCAALLPETLLHAAASDQIVSIKPKRPEHPTPPAFSASPVSLTFSASAGQKNLPSQEVTLKNGSKKTLYWRTSLTALGSGALGIAPAGGAIAPGKTAQVRVMVDIRRLKVGTYSFTCDLLGLDAKNKAVTGSPLAIKVTVLIRAIHVLPLQQ